MSAAQTSSESENKGRTVARNFGVLMASQATTWILAMVAAVVIPRYLGSELVGRFHLSNSIWAVGLVMTAFGTHLSLVKAVARDASRTGPLLASGLALRMMLWVPVSIVLFGYAFAVGYPRQVLILMLIVGIATIFATATGCVAAVLQGLDKMGIMSMANILGRLVFVVGAVIMLILGYSVYTVAIAGGIGTVVGLLIQLWAIRRVRRESGDDSPLSVDMSSIKELARDSLPYFWIALFIVLYQQVDTIVISLVVGRDEVLGWYSVFDKFIGTLLFVPNVFMAAVYPTLSRMYENRAEGDTSSGPGNRLTQKTFETLLLISIPVGFGISVTSRPVVELLYGSDFVNAAPVVAVGGVVISLTYLTTVLGMFLISMDFQRVWTRFIALGAFLTIPLDLVLVPLFESQFDNGAIGGAAAYAVTETIILGGAIYLLPRGALGSSPLYYAFKVIAAGAIMAGAVYLLRQQYLLLQIVAGAVVYLVMVFALRLIAPEDKKLILERLPLPANRRN